MDKIFKYDETECCGKCFDDGYDFNHETCHCHIKSTCGPFVMGEIEKPCCDACPACECHSKP